MFRHRLILMVLLHGLTAAVVANAAETTGFVLTSDYATGSLSAIDLSSRAVTIDVFADVCGDARLRWFDGKLYVINRGGCDNITITDPTNNYAFVRQFSVGNGANPADIEFVSDTKAYVTRYDLASLLIVNPETGLSTGQISLAAFADADGVPEMDHMARIGNRVFVAMQRLDRPNNYAPTDSSLVAVIDAVADTIIDVDPAAPGVQAIALQGTNPFTAFAFDRASNRLLIGCVGRFGVPDAGIEWIDPVALRSLGFAITESALGGDPIAFAWNGPDHSYAIANDGGFNTALKSWSATSGTALGTLFNPGGYSLADVAVNDRGEVFLCDNLLTAPGLFIYSTADDQLLAGPLDTGLPPVQIVFDHAEDPVLAAPDASPRFRFAPPSPNPAARNTHFALTLTRTAQVAFELFDPAGRRVRRWDLGTRRPGESGVEWDLRDSSGARVHPGLYLVRASADEFSIVRRVAVLY